MTWRICSDFADTKRMPKKNPQNKLGEYTDTLVLSCVARELVPTAGELLSY